MFKIQFWASSWHEEKNWDIETEDPETVDASVSSFFPRVFHPLANFSSGYLAFFLFQRIILFAARNVEVKRGEPDFDAWMVNKLELLENTETLSIKWIFKNSETTTTLHIESNSNTAASELDRDHRSKCSLYQAKFKDYHDTKQHACPHNFSVGDVVFFANMKPNKLDSKSSLAKHVIIENKARETFSLVNVDTGTTLVRNAKYLKHAPSETIKMMIVK